MYVNASKAVPQTISLIEMGNPKPRIPMQTNNLDAHSGITNNIHPRRRTETEIIFHWLNVETPNGTSGITGDRDNRTEKTTGQNTIQRIIKEQIYKKCLHQHFN